MFYKLFSYKCFSYITSYDNKQQKITKIIFDYKKRELKLKL